MGVSARYSKDAGEVLSNKPSASRESFERKRSSAAPAVRRQERKTMSTAVDSEVTMQKGKSPQPIVQATGDRSAELLASLDEKHRTLFAEIPDDRAITVDALAKLGYSIGEIMTAMTMLELKGLVSSLPGGLYIKR